MVKTTPQKIVYIFEQMKMTKKLMKKLSKHVPSIHQIKFEDFRP